MARLLPLLLLVLAPALFAQRVPIGAEGKRVLAIELAVQTDGQVVDRDPDSARRHTVLSNLRTREARPFKSDDLALDLKYLTETSHLFRAADWQVNYDEKLDGVKVKLILTQPLVQRIRVVAPHNGSFSEDGVRDFWRSQGKLDTAEGAEFSIPRLNADIARLFDSGAFLDVRSDYKYGPDGVEVLLRVIQNQPLAILQFSGVNQTSYTTDLEKIIAGIRALKEPASGADAEELNLPSYFPREAFEGEMPTDASPAAIQGASSLIQAYYRLNGFAFAEVTPRVMSLARAYDAASLQADYTGINEASLARVRELIAEGYGGRTVLLFEVYEGPRVIVGEIKFEGLEGLESPDGSDALESSRIQGFFAPLESVWFDLFRSDKAERERALAEVMRMKSSESFVLADATRDAEALQSYFQERGWLDARASFSGYEFNRARSRVNLVYSIVPGPLYAAGDVRIEFQTQFPRVPKGVQQPDYDPPALEWNELLELLDAEEKLLQTSQVLSRWGADYLGATDSPQFGKHLRAYTLGRPVVWDEYLLNGEPGTLKEGLAGRIRALLASKGYSNVEIEFVRVETLDATVATDWETPLPVRRVGMILRINQGYKSVVGNVTFRGNEDTRDDVLRRQVSLYPGETFDRNKLDASSRRLRRTQWFEQAAPGQGVIARTTPRLLRVGDEVVEYTDVDYEVVEGRTNSFNFSAGFSSANGFTASVDLALRNFDISSLVSWLWGEPNFSFTGAGQNLSLTIQPPLDRQQVYRISFSEPWLFGYPVEGGGAAEYSSQDFGDYTRTRAGVDPYAGWRVLPDVLWSAGYGYSIITLQDIAGDAPQELKDDEGTDKLSTLWSEIRWTTTDNPQFPTQGWDLSYRFSYTGGLLGGTLDYWRMNARAQYYLPLADIDQTRTLVLALSVSGYWQDVHSDTEEIPFIERFLMGGNSVSGRGLLRGFRYGGVGPSRDGVALGGNFMLTGFAELRFPVFPGTLWFVGFVDAGALTPTLNTFDPDAITVSAGVGLRLLLPILPIPFALDFGFPVRNLPGNREEVISVNLGFGF